MPHLTIKKRLGIFIVLGAAWAFPQLSQAMSVSWQGSTAVMTANQPFLTDWLVAYSFRKDAAVAARYMRMIMNDGSEMKIYAPQLDFLLRRWNGKDYQANIYLNGALGVENFQGQNSSAGIGTLDVDVESRELYTSLKLQANLVGAGPNVYQTELRLGAAPFKADFEEIAAWLIVSVQSNPQLIRSFSVTPMLRLFYKNALLEVGASAQGDFALNSMIHF